MCMDKQNYKDVMRVRERLGKGKGKGMGKAEVRLFGDWGGRKGEVVEDPYYGGDEGFEIAYEQVVRFTRGFLKEVVGGEEGTERGKGRDEEVEVEEGVR